MDNKIQKYNLGLVSDQKQLVTISIFRLSNYMDHLSLNGQSGFISVTLGLQQVQELDAKVKS